MAMTHKCSESHPVPKSVVLKGRRKAARHQRGLLQEYREQVQDPSTSEHGLVLEEGVPANQVMRLMGALRLSRPAMAAIIGLTTDCFDQHLAADKPFGGAPGRALLGIMHLITAAESIRDPATAAAANPTPELLVGKWIDDQLGAESGDEVHSRLESGPGLANLTERFISESSPRMIRDAG